jgi:general secretion pathway protein H
MSFWLDSASSSPLPLRIVFGREPVDKIFSLTLGTASTRVVIRADGIGNFEVD